MKIILLFEAFKSKILTKKLSELDMAGRAGSETKNAFLAQLREDMAKLELPASEMPDEYLKVKNAEEAFEDVDLPLDNLYSIKYWFDKQNNFSLRTFTYCGPENYDLNSENLEKIDSTEDYSNLKTGDKVLVEIKNNIFTEGIIFIEDNYMFVIQDKFDGSSPDTSDEWKKFGKFSWTIYKLDTSRKISHYSIYKVNGEVEKRLQSLNYTSKSTIDRNLLAKEDIAKYDSAIIFYVYDWIKDKNPKELIDFRKYKRELKSKELDPKSQNIENISKKLLEEYLESEDPFQIFNIIVNNFFLFENRDTFLFRIKEFCEIISQPVSKISKTALLSKLKTIIIDSITEKMREEKAYDELIKQSNVEDQELLSHLKKINELVKTKSLEVDEKLEIYLFKDTLDLLLKSDFWNKSFSILIDIRRGNQIDYPKSKSQLQRLEKYVKSIF